MKVIELPTGNIQDIPRGLRALADSIESGKYGDAHLCAWTIDCGDGRVEFGMLGQTPEPGAVAHLLFSICQRRLEGV